MSQSTCILATINLNQRTFILATHCFASKDTFETLFQMKSVTFGFAADTQRTICKQTSVSIYWMALDYMHIHNLAACDGRGGLRRASTSSSELATTGHA